MKKNNRNLFRLTRFVLLKLPALLRLFPRKPTSRKKLLIIKNDAIGDYILFRNYLEIVRFSAAFGNYEIHLLGNGIWQDLATRYDAVFVDKLTFISPVQLYHQPLKTLKLGWYLFRQHYDTVWQPTYSRTLLNDGLAALSNAKQTIGFNCTTETIFEKYKRKTDTFYTRRYDLPGETFFEFERNRFFFSNVLGINVVLKKPFLPVAGNSAGGYIIVYPGAGVVKRQWAAVNFIEVCRHILDKSKYPILIAGSKNEEDLCEQIRASLNSPLVTAIAGRTSLPEMVELISKAKMVISNESAAVQIAAACNVPVISITGGGHFGRFVPYPPTIPNSVVCAYEHMPCFNCNWFCIYQTQATEAYPCVAKVTVEQVKEQIDALL